MTVIPSGTLQKDLPRRGRGTAAAVDEGRGGVFHCRNNGRRGRHTESHRRERPVCRSAAWQIYPVRTTGTTHRHVIPSERSESRNLRKWQVLSCGGSLSNVEDSSTPLTGRNDIIGGRLYEFAYCFYSVLRRPATSSVRAAPCQLPRRGSFCSVLSGAERHIGRSLRFR